MLKVDSVLLVPGDQTRFSFPTFAPFLAATLTAAGVRLDYIKNEKWISKGSFVFFVATVGQELPEGFDWSLCPIKIEDDPEGTHYLFYALVKYERA